MGVLNELWPWPARQFAGMRLNSPSLRYVFSKLIIDTTNVLHSIIYGVVWMHSRVLCLRWLAIAATSGLTLADQASAWPS